jgi:hypothetical protein
VVLVAVIAVAAGSSGSGVTNEPVQSDQGSGATDEPSAQHDTGDDGPASIGQAIHLEGSDGSINVKLTRWVANATATDSFSSPENGKRFVAAQFRITAVGGGYSDSPSNGAYAIDSKGQQYDTAFVEEIRQGICFGGSVKIREGSSALGFIVFEVPKNAKISKVQFSEDSGFGQTGEWIIQ